jgi:hypothetical protein
MSQIAWALSGISDAMLPVPVAAARNTSAAAEVNQVVEQGIREIAGSTSIHTRLILSHP